MKNKNYHKYKIQEYDTIDYASLWSGRKRKYLDAIERDIINRLVQPSSNKRLIDLGCGFGRLSETYLYKYKKVILFDYSKKNLLQAAEKISNNEKVSFIQGDVYNLPFKDNSFDTVFMIRLFHHLEDPTRVISEVRRILRGEGNFLFTFYNKYDLRTRCKSFLRLSSPGISRVQHENVSKDGLLYVSDPDYVKQFLSQHGFVIKGRYGIGFLKCGFLKYSRIPGLIEKYLYKFSGRFNLTTEIFIHATLKKNS